MPPIAPRWQRSEQAWCLAANRWGARQAVRAYFRLISRLGDGVFWYALMAALAMLDGWRGLGAAGHMLATSAIAAADVPQAQALDQTPAPLRHATRRIQAWVAPLDEFSFPSGHTLQAVSFTLVALAYYPALAWLLVPFTLSVAISRVVLGLHYPSDVIAATAIGGALASVSLWVVPGVSLFL